MSAFRRGQPGAEGCEEGSWKIRVRWKSKQGQLELGGREGKRAEKRTEVEETQEKNLEAVGRGENSRGSVMAEEGEGRASAKGDAVKKVEDWYCLIWSIWSEM